MATDMAITRGLGFWISLVMMFILCRFSVILNFFTGFGFTVVLVLLKLILFDCMGVLF